MSIWIYPYKMGSKSVKALSEALGARVIKREGSRFREGRGKHIINWGASRVPYGNALNHHSAVALAGNKLHCFKTLNAAEISIPEFTTDSNTATDWYGEGKIVVLRHKLNGHSGEGIEIVDPKQGDLMSAAPLYVQYIPKKDEYRVHIFKFEQDDVRAIHVQQKKRKLDVADDDVNWQVRNLDGGFIFATGGVEPPEDVIVQAKAALVASGLTFGAVDVIWNQKQQKAFCLEINTAPGLEGTTVTKYAEAFKEYFGE